MKAVYYTEPRNFSVTDRPVPQINDEEVLIRTHASGLCGTDQHIHEGEFIAKFPLCPGHEAVGSIVKIGSKVQNLQVGQRAVLDTNSGCHKCRACNDGKTLFCENLEAKGVTTDGGFAEYSKWHFSKVYPIKNLTDVEACLVEPASCAIHGADILKLPVGSSVLLCGAGPTGLLLAQLLRQNGAVRMVVAANAGLKMKIAREVNAADEYIDLDRDRTKAAEQWDQIKKDNPDGFDAVIEATGVASIAERAIKYVKKGGTLMLYGVYGKDDRVSWAPDDIFGNEIRIQGSFAQVNCFSRAVAYLDSGKVNVKPMVTDVFPLEKFQNALDKVASRQCLKVVIAAKDDLTKP